MDKWPCRDMKTNQIWKSCAETVRSVFQWRLQRLFLCLFCLFFYTMFKHTQTQMLDSVWRQKIDFGFVPLMGSNQGAASRLTGLLTYLFIEMPIHQLEHQADGVLIWKLIALLQFPSRGKGPMCTNTLTLNQKVSLKICCSCCPWGCVAFGVTGHAGVKQHGWTNT